MELIAEFIARYRGEFDGYDETATLIAEALDSNLHATDIVDEVIRRSQQKPPALK